jgi:hypothetical protein
LDDPFTDGKEIERKRMGRHLNYFKYVVRHKWYVLLAALHIIGKSGDPKGLLAKALLHDLSKFRPSEWFPYAECFYEEDGSKRYVESQDFILAWNSHQKVNKHHWQYWLIMMDSGTWQALEMPEVYAYEMVCLTPETEISLMDGREVQIKDLVGVREFYVYSRDLSTGEIVPGRAHSCRKTSERERIIKITLDDGEIVRCTPSHPFLLKSLRYKAASDLKIGDSLSPLYRKYDDKGYEQILHKGSDEWEYTHRISYHYKFGKRLPKAPIAHHRDFDKRNNDPRNIVASHAHNHWKYHSKRTNKMIELGRIPWKDLKFIEWNKKRIAKRIAEGTFVFQLDKIREMSSRRLIDYNNKNYKNGTHVCQQQWYLNMLAERNKSEKMREISSKNGKSMCKMNSDQNFNKRQQLGKCNKIIQIIQDNNEEINKSNYERAKKLHRKPHAQIPSYEWYCDAVSNHKIISIEFDGYSEVYNFTVDRFNNFALHSGVFVHNCDWMGAGRAITGKWEAGEWYRTHRGSMFLHQKTRELVENIIC